MASKWAVLDKSPPIFISLFSKNLLSDPQKRPYRGRVIKKKLHRTNQEITAAFVRMVGEQVEPKICSIDEALQISRNCLLYTSPSPRDATLSRMPSSA